VFEQAKSVQQTQMMPCNWSDVTDRQSSFSDIPADHPDSKKAEMSDYFNIEAARACLLVACEHLKTLAK
jgi:hypothetical protein